MHNATAFRIVLAALLCRAAFAAEGPAVEKKAQAATQIYVRTAPPGAVVRLDSKEEGTAPGIFVVPAGVTKMTVEVELDGVKESRVIEIRGGKITRVEFELGKDGAQPSSKAQKPASAPSPSPEAVAEEFLKAVAGRDDHRALTFVRGGGVNLADLSRLRDMYRLQDHVLTSVFIERNGAKVVHALPALGGKWRINLEFSLDTGDGGWRIYALDERPVERLGPRGLADAADGDAVRAVIARFAALARAGDTKKAVAETFADDAEDIKRAVAVFTDAVAAGVDATHIRCVAVGKEGAAVLTHPAADETVGAICYSLRVGLGGWRIDDISIRHGAGGAFIDRDEPPPFDVTFEFVLADPERRVAELLDLDTGAFATMKEFGADDRETHKWVRDHGMDALGVIEKDTAGVMLFDVATIDVPPEKWGTITPEEIANNPALKQKEPDKITPLPCQPSSPVPTCIFRTREGSLGVLQVLGASEAPKGVKIRYRLANAPQGANAVPPGERARRFVRVVIGEDAMTFQGAPTSWEELPKLLEAVPDRGRTVLELAGASAELPMARINEAAGRLQPLVLGLGFEYLSLIGVHPLDSKGTSTALRGQVDFRLAPVREEGKLLGLTELEIERYSAEFKAKGPSPVKYGKDPFVWCRVAKAVAPPERFITAEREGWTYVLLSNRPAETMLTLWGDSNPWRLAETVLTLEDGKPDRPAIALRLNKEGGWRMGALTEAHVGWPMAALVDGEVYSMPTIRSKVTDAIVITGVFTKEEATELVERLKSGVSR